MRFLLLLLAVLFALPAHAESRLKLVADRPVIIVVNLVPHPVGDTAPVMLTLEKGKEGTQRITVRNLAGQEMYQGTVVVPEGMVVTVAWRDRQLEVVERAQLKTSDAFNSGKGAPKQAAGHRRLDAIAAGAEEHNGDLLALAASDVPTYAGDDTGLGVIPNESTAPAVAEISQGDGSSGATGANDADVEHKVLAGGDAADAAVIELVPRSQSWANVWVGGEKVWEYRGKGDVLELRLGAGSHAVAVKDFRDRDSWGTGTLVVSPGQRAAIHFSMSQAPEVVGGTWTPDP